jgi:hypothetical protein
MDDHGFHEVITMSTNGSLPDPQQERKRQRAERQQKKPVSQKQSPVVPRHLRCKCCFNGYGGVYRIYKTIGGTRYFKCDTCGYNDNALIVDIEQSIRLEKLDNLK